MEKANKYILLRYKDKADIRCGFVFRHADLLERNESDQDVLGGGYFKFDDDIGAVILYGKSDDYGYPKNLEELLKKMPKDYLMGAFGEEYYWHFTDQEREMPADYKLMITDLNGKTTVVR
jgi:hypothetical protein